MKRKFIRKKKTGTTSKVGEEECDSEIPGFDFTELNDASHEVEDKSVDESVGSENGESEDKNEGEDGKQKSQKKDQNKLSLTEGDAILSSIKNKLRRRELYQQYKKEKLKAKKEARKQRQREYELLGDDAPPKPEPKTIENTREPDDTFVDPEDEEVKEDEAVDEMASYFRGEREPKVLITTSDNPHTKTIKFCRELMQTIPNAEFRWRNRARIKNIIANAPARGYTDIVVINEDLRKPNGLLLIHLPDGPTAYFRLSSVRYCKDIRHRASLSAHRPEVIINNFKTRLGHTVGRMIACLFHFDPQFHGRRVATFHNQRDYIFFRHHRYQFKNGQKVALQEIGPRFTLKLRWLQKGTFDTKYGEFEWLLKVRKGPYILHLMSNFIVAT